jgi:hypothetical protein
VGSRVYVPWFAITTEPEASMVQFGAVSLGAQSRIDPAARVVPVAAESPVPMLALNVPATVALVSTFIV